MEYRISETIVRDLGNGRIGGTASVVFNGEPGTEYNIYGKVFERIAPGAFDAILRKEPDVVATFNHNTDLILGRTPNTLKIYSDKTGLHYEIDPPDTEIGRTLKTLVARGDVRGSSFAAVIGFAEWSKEGDKEIRTIKRFSHLLDVSPVVHPAYGSTKSMMRSEIDSIEKEKYDYYRMMETTARIEKLRQQTK